MMDNTVESGAGFKSIPSILEAIRKGNGKRNRPSITVGNPTTVLIEHFILTLKCLQSTSLYKMQNILKSGVSQILLTVRVLSTLHKLIH